jgi:hypothetical protein
MSTHTGRPKHTHLFRAHARAYAREDQRAGRPKHTHLFRAHARAYAREDQRAAGRAHAFAAHGLALGVSGVRASSRAGD